jgi:hypothetical protein
MNRSNYALRNSIGNGRCQDCGIGEEAPDDVKANPTVLAQWHEVFGASQVPLFRLGNRSICSLCMANIGNWKGATTESIAFITNTPRGDLVIAASGKTITYELENSGARLEDVLLHDAPLGFSIWEGTYRYDSDRDPTVRGSFRPLTLAEWGRVVETGVPWIEEQTEANAQETISGASMPPNDCPVYIGDHRIGTTTNVMVRVGSSVLCGSSENTACP